MEFEWDEVKAKANQLKHGVSFLEATEVFADPYSACAYDPDHSQDTERTDSIRIISARPMTRRERKAYEQ
ncbi:MAG: BrnT family toxin [Cyanobacteria bacterium P01_G01_bin.54]